MGDSSEGHTPTWAPTPLTALFDPPPPLRGLSTTDVNVVECPHQDEYEDSATIDVSSPSESEDEDFSDVGSIQGSPRRRRAAAGEGRSSTSRQ